jgi:predicted metal-dependent hydrolase
MMELDYQIVRSPKRKTLTISVERDRSIIIHAPEGTSEEEVRRVVDAQASVDIDETQPPAEISRSPAPARQGSGEWRISPQPGKGLQD